MARPKTDAQLAAMTREELEAEVAALRKQVDEAAPVIVAETPAKTLADTDLAPPWIVPLEMCGQDLRRNGISAYCSDGKRLRHFIPGQRVTTVTIACQREVLSILGRAADQYRLNMENHGKTVQGMPMEFGA